MTHDTVAYISLRFNGHFPREPGSSEPMFIEAKDDGGGGDNWSYKSYKAPVKSSPPTNQHPFFSFSFFFYRPYVLPVVQPTVSKH